MCHLIKNVHNNWLTEGKQQLTFQSTNVKEGTICAKWADICNIYLEERGNIVRTTTLCDKAVDPTPLERQNVFLVMKVFNDKTVAALS